MEKFRQSHHKEGSDDWPSHCGYPAYDYVDYCVEPIDKMCQIWANYRIVDGIKHPCHAGERSADRGCAGRGDPRGALVRAVRRCGEVALEFALPGAREPVHAEAQVVRHSVPDREGVTGMGLKFTGLPPEHKTRLEQYLRGQAVDESS